jgi:hypothetical protein
MAMHQAQGMRSAQAQAQAQVNSFPSTTTHTPQTPNMSSLAMDGSGSSGSPLTLSQPIGVSPRNPMTARGMNREASRTGMSINPMSTMGPPQSPAATGRAITPKPGTAGKTPKSSKDELMVSLG